jgi:hypothetical protein
MSPGSAKSGATTPGSMPAPSRTRGRVSAGVETASVPTKPELEPAAERAGEIVTGHPKPATEEHLKTRHLR